MTTTTQITVGTGGTYTTVAAFASALAAKNFVTEDLMWDVRVLENTSFNSTTLGSLGADQTRYCRIRPAAGQGVNDLNATLNFPSTGITLASNLRTPCIVGLGVVIEGFRIDITLTGGGDFQAWKLTGLSDAYPNAPCAMRRNRISAFMGGENVFIAGGSADLRADFTDNLFVGAGGSDVIMVRGGGRCERNTFVNTGAANNAMYAGGGQLATFRDNVCIGFGDKSVLNGIPPTCSNNFYDAATVTTAGFTNSTVTAMCVSSTDFRTNPTGPLVGAGSTAAENTLDIFGFNRGTDPDVGAAEYQVVATVPAAPTITSATKFSSQPTNFSYNLQYTVPADNGAVIDYITFNISPATPQGQTEIFDSSIDGIKTINFAEGTAYTITAKAHNSVGDGPLSAPFTFTVAVAPPAGSTVPNPPGNVVATAGDGTVSVAFTVPVSNGDAPITGYTVTASTGQTASGSSSPIVIAMPNGTAVTFTVVATNINGNSAPSSSSASVTPVAPGTPTSDIINIKTVGAGRQIATVDALESYIAGLDCVALGKLTVIYVYDNLDISNRTFAPKTHNESCYVAIYPAPGQSVNDGLTDAYTGNYGSTGIVLSVASDTNYTGFKLGYGMSMQGFRFRGTGTGTSLNMTSGQSLGREAELRYNRIWITSSGATGYPIFTGQYGAWANVRDNYFLFDGTAGGDVWGSYGPARIERNTIVRKNGGAYAGNFINGANGTFRDNVLLGFGANVLNNTGAFGNRSNNYVDYPQTTADAAIIVGTTSALVVSLDDARPAVGSPIIGGGSSTAISINDLRGGNRGPTPDAGAFQRTAATPLPIGVVTVEVMDGATLVISGTTTNAPASGKITLSPGNPSNGAQSVGPLDLVLGTGTFSKEIDDLVPGNYNVTMTLTNAGGTSLVSGTSAFEVAGVGNLVYDTGLSGTGGGGTDPVLTLPAPTISIATSDATIMAGKRASVSGAVNLNGDTAGHIDVFLDPQPSGSPVSLGAANVLNSTWTKQADIPPGLYKVRVVATSNAQTATVSTGNVRVLDLTGNFTLPTA